MNLLTIIVLAIMLLKMIQGYKKGMVKEIISFVSLVVMCVLVILIGAAVRSYVEREFVGVIVAVVLLSILGIAHHLLGLVFFSAKLVAKLPVIRLADKLLGILIGALETVVFIWTVYAFVRVFALGVVGEMILVYTNESPILLWINENNLVIGWVEWLSEMISFIQF